MRVPVTHAVRIRFRPARPEDTEAARAVHHAAYRDVVERQFGEWDEARQDRFFEGDWGAGGYDVMLDGDTIVGYVAVDDLPRAVHIRELVIALSHQGRGIGTRILRDAMAAAAARRVPAHIGALHENRALALYRRLGFRDTGTTETHTLLEWVPPSV